MPEMLRYQLLREGWLAGSTTLSTRPCHQLGTNEVLFFIFYFNFFLYFIPPDGTTDYYVQSSFQKFKVDQFNLMREYTFVMWLFCGRDGGSYEHR